MDRVRDSDGDRVRDSDGDRVSDSDGDRDKVTDKTWTESRTGTGTTENIEALNFENQ
jgi:hypothetical protein